MTLRKLAREVKEFPATTTFCLLWIVVFVAMVGDTARRGGLSLMVEVAAAGHRRRPSFWRPGAPGPGSWRILAADHFDVHPFQRPSPGVERDRDVSTRHNGGIVVWNASVYLHIRSDRRRRQSGLPC